MKKKAQENAFPGKKTPLCKKKAQKTLSMRTPFFMVPYL